MIELKIPAPLRDEVVRLCHEDNVQQSLLSHYRLWAFIESNIEGFVSAEDWDIDLVDVLNPVLRSPSQKEPK